MAHLRKIVNPSHLLAVELEPIALEAPSKLQVLAKHSRRRNLHETETGFAKSRIRVQNPALPRKSGSPDS